MDVIVVMVLFAVVMVMLNNLVFKALVHFTVVVKAMVEC